MPHSICILGPPGSGKSSLAAKIAEHEGGNAVLLALKPREANSYGYVQLGSKLTVDRFADFNWKPDLDSYKATAYIALLKRLDELISDATVDTVIVDPLTEAGEFVAHFIMSAEKAVTPREMNDPRSFYGSFKYRLKQILTACTTLIVAPHPKTVIVTCHTQPAKDNELGQQGITFEGEVLPALEGQIRQHVAGDFDLVLYTTIERTFNQKTRTRESRYMVQVRGNPERAAKIAIAPALTDELLPNDWKVISAAIKKAQV